jgi:hypothetical protein
MHMYLALTIKDNISDTKKSVEPSLVNPFAMQGLQCAESSIFNVHLLNSYFKMTTR